MKKGFTLIELLVVIAIIGLLASVVLVSLNSARARAKDVKRIADIQQMQKAIEMYFTDNGKYPPIHNAAMYPDTNGDGCGYYGRWCTLQGYLAPYMIELPTDPSGNWDTYVILYSSEATDKNQSYGLMVRLEHSSNFPLVINDGGYFNSTTNGQYYELGGRPAYCMSKYTGTSASWMTATSNICVGGN